MIENIQFVSVLALVGCALYVMFTPAYKLSRKAIDLWTVISFFSSLALVVTTAVRFFT